MMEYFDWMIPIYGSSESICFQYDTVDHCSGIPYRGIPEEWTTSYIIRTI